MVLRHCQDVVITTGEIVLLLQTNNPVVRLDKELDELIQIAIKTEILLEEIKYFLSGSKSVFTFEKNE